MQYKLRISLETNKRKWTRVVALCIRLRPVQSQD